MKKISIAIVTNSFPKISETFIFNKVSGLVKAGFEVTVITYSAQNDYSFFENRATLQKINIVNTLSIYSTFEQIMRLISNFINRPFYNFEILKKIYYEEKNLKNVIVLYFKLYPYIRKKFDIIHFEFSGIAVSNLSILKYLKDTKISLSCRGSAEKITPFFIPKRKKQLGEIFEQASLVHCVSNDMALTCSAYGLNIQKVLINFPSINTEIFKRKIAYKEKQNGIFTIISVGRLHWKKGYPYALLAIKELINTFKIPVRYEIIGEGVEKEQIIFMINELGIKNYVILLGNKSSEEVKERLEKSDVFLLSSLSEGISNSAMEAMAMEIPIISSNVDGMGELINDGENGFLVQPYTPREISEKVLLLYKDFEFRMRMGQEARKKVKQEFNLDLQIKKFVTAYTKLNN